MSGGGPGSSRSDGFGSGSGTDNCDIVKEVPLNSPNQGVLDVLSVGDKLFVVSENNSVLAKTATGETAGSLSYTGFALLVTCIAQGYSYEAIVTFKDGAVCKVRIQPAE